MQSLRARVRAGSPVTPPPIDPQLIHRFDEAAADLERRYPADRLGTSNAESELRKWLDSGDDPLPWAFPDRVTVDEWFFITTLYGEMTLAGQRAHIRRYFGPLFIQAADRDIR